MFSYALLALALSAFGIGTTEFVIMGLLPDVAHDLGVTIPMAGLLVTGYALGVAIGAPIMAMLTARLPRKKALLILMGIFIVGNILCAVSGNYTILMIARIVTALCHGAFFGIGSVEAVSLAPENRKASAIAMMFTGLTIANVLGVPFGTMLGQQAGWRSTFWVVAVIGVIAFIALAKFLPRDNSADETDLKQEMQALRDGRVWTSLLMTILFAASVFALFTYIAPILGDVTGISPKGVSYTLLLVGVGLTIGNVIGGRLADWKLAPTLFGSFALISILHVIFHWTSLSFLPAEITLFLWGAVFFAGCAAVHFNAITTGKDAPNLISTLNIGAFNIGNALGAWVGGVVLNAGFSLRDVPLSASLLSTTGLIVTALFLWASRHRQQLQPQYSI